MANKKLSELTTATGATTSWFIPICDPATGLAYKMTASAFSTLIGGGGGDVTAPTVVSAIAATATTIVVTFSESVTVTTAGWSFKKNGAAWTIVNVTGSGTSWTFNMATSAVLGDTLLRTYDSGTGATIDASSNELVSFTDSSITNSIGDTTAPTVVSAALTTYSNVQIVFSETVTATTAGWSFKKNGSAWAISSVSGSGTTWNFAMGSSAVDGDTILRTYDSTTGATVDNASNELVSFTDQAVTNTLVEAITWNQLVLTSNTGSGTVTGTSASVPRGATASKKLVNSTGNYAEYTVPSSLPAGEAIAFGFFSDNDADYDWSDATNNILGAAYYFSTTYYKITGSTNASPSAISGTPTIGDVIRLEISGNDIVIKRNGSSIGTITGVLSGVADIFIRVIFTAAVNSQHLDTCKGFGLTTI